MNNTTLGDADGLADVGDVDMFGLDEFGGATREDMWGAVIGNGTATVASIAIRKLTKPYSTYSKYSEGIGALVGAAAGAIMYAFPKTKGMGMSAIANAVIGNGLRQLEQSFLAPSPAEQMKAMEDAMAAVSGMLPSKGGWGNVTIDPTAVIQPYQGLGIHTIEPGYAVNNGLGAVTIDPGYPVPGSVQGGYGFGAARPELVGPPTLVGAGDYGMSENAGATQTKLLGGPSVSALGSHYGATLFGHQG
jgi:hypothetical protein